MVDMADHNSHAVRPGDPQISRDDSLALVLAGGGARTAYQVGALAGIAERAGSGVRFPIVTGVSGGAINAGYLSSHEGSFGAAVGALERAWLGMSIESVFRAGVLPLLWSGFKWGCMLSTRGAAPGFKVQGVLDTQPLRETLSRHVRSKCIDANLSSGRLPCARTFRHQLRHR